MQVYTSLQLTIGEVYTRDQLKKQFHITDAAINNGLFQPKGTKSIWLFITEHKTAGMEPYHDLLLGNLLTIQGQKKGRTDNKIIFHQQNDVELLIFYRKKKYEFPGAGFKYEGKFEYSSHSGSLPTAFVLVRELDKNQITAIQTKLEQAHEFNPHSLSDGKEKILASIVRRRGQAAFRKSLLNAYQKTVP